MRHGRGLVAVALMTLWGCGPQGKLDNWTETHREAHCYLAQLAAVHPLYPSLGFLDEAIRRLRELRCLGRPILLGTSRKSVIGKTLDLPVDQRLEGTAATVAVGIANGADIVRVHDVKEMVRVARMTDAIIGRGS